MVKLEDLKSEVKKALKSGKVKYFIAYQEGNDGYKPIPVFLKEESDTANLVWNPGCVHNLVKFLVDEKRRKKRSDAPDADQRRLTDMERFTRANSAFCAWFANGNL